MLFFIAGAAFTATLLGGLFALRFKDKLHLILGFSAGAVIGVAFFDLLPEAIELTGSHYSTAVATSFVALGFTLYLILDRIFAIHGHGEHEGDQMQRGILGASSLSIHSFLDGVAIGLAFQVGAAVGVIVAVAVLVHDFSDGINTVNLIIKNDGSRRQGVRWLFVDALAPVLGLASTYFFTLPEHALGLVLALFTGFFLYIGASDMVPESHHRHPTVWTTAMTVVGIVALYLAIQLAHF